MVKSCDYFILKRASSILIYAPPLVSIECYFFFLLSAPLHLGPVRLYAHIHTLKPCGSGGGHHHLRAQLDHPLQNYKKERKKKSPQEEKERSVSALVCL